MNKAALKRLASEYEMVTTYLSSIKNVVGTNLAFFDDQVRLNRLLSVAYTCQKAPQIWMAFGRDESEYKTPPFVATTAKLSLGLVDLAMHALENGHSNVLEESASTLVEYCEEHSLFIGKYEVCAGPPAMIESMLALVLAEPDKRRSLDDDIENVIRYSILCRAAEAIAVAYSILRLAKIATNDRDAIKASIKPTHPYVLNVVDAVSRDVPISETRLQFVMTKLWYDQRTKQIISDSNELVCELLTRLHGRPSAVFATATDLDNLTRSIVSAFNSISKCIDQLEIAPRSTRDWDVDLFRQILGDVQ